MSIRPEFERAVSLLKDGDVVIEIGSHQGDGAILMLSKGATVYAIEPYYETYNKLIKKVKTTFLCAIGPKNDSSKYLYSISDKKESRCSTFYKKALKEKSVKTHKNIQKNMVPVVTLDTFIKFHKIDKIDLIRFDCYGAEYDIFEGPTKFLEKAKMILIAIHNKPPLNKYKTRRENIINKLVDNGYKLKYGSPIKKNKHIHQLWVKK